MARPTMQFNHLRTSISLSFSSFKDPILWRPSPIARSSDPSREGSTKGARIFDVQRNTQVVSHTDRYTCFVYPHAARPWIGHVRQSYFVLLYYLYTCALTHPINNNAQRQLIITFLHLLFSLVCLFTTSCSRTFWYVQYARGISVPHNTARKV